MENSSEKQEKTPEKSENRLLKKSKSVLKHITVELNLLLYVVAISISLVAVQNLYIEKACRINLNFTSSVCDNVMIQNLSKGSMEEIEIQQLISKMSAWRAPIESMPALLVIFLGAWSDKLRRRRPFILLPIIGELIAAVGLLLSTFYLLEWPMEVAGLIEVIPPSIVGSTVTMMMANYAYMADISTPKERTFRIGILNVIMSVSYPIGMSFGGILLKTFGYYGIFSITLTLNVLGLMYVIFVLKEKYSNPNDVKIKNKETIKNEKGEFVALSLLKQTVNVIFKKRKGNKQKQLLLILLTYTICNGPIAGSYHLFYMYLRRKFMFDEMKYGVYSMYSTVVEMTGMLFVLTFLSKKLQISNGILGAIGIFFTIISKFAFALAPTVKWLYLAPIPDSVQSLIFVSIRSMASSVVDEDELGKVFSFIGMLDAILTLTFKPTMAMIYVYTLEVFPGAYFIVQAIILCPSFFVFLYIYKIQKASEINELKKAEEATIEETMKLNIP